MSNKISKKPNIVYILVDNTGWGAFSVYGGTVATPNIDKLANQGIRFAVCAEMFALVGASIVGGGVAMVVQFRVDIQPRVTFPCFGGRSCMGIGSIR